LALYLATLRVVVEERRGERGRAEKNSWKQIGFLPLFAAFIVASLLQKQAIVEREEKRAGGACGGRREILFHYCQQILHSHVPPPLEE
jgi:hypothetical protein